MADRPLAATQAAAEAAGKASMAANMRGIFRVFKLFRTPSSLRGVLAEHGVGDGLRAGPDQVPLQPEPCVARAPRVQPGFKPLAPGGAADFLVDSSASVAQRSWEKASAVSRAPRSPARRNAAPLCSRASAAANSRSSAPRQASCRAAVVHHLAHARAFRRHDGPAAIASARPCPAFHSSRQNANTSIAR